MVVLMMLPGITSAAEIRAFRLTEVDGFVALRYLLDEYTTSSQGVDARKDRNPTFQEEISLNTQSYIYHPTLLNMNLGGSVLYDQSDYETLQGKTSSDAQRFNYYAYLDFLEKKPYPLTLYYDQQNPSVSTGLTGRYIQENTRYGFDFSLLEPFSPVTMTLGAYRQTSQGEGVDQIVDDVQEQANIRIYHAYGKGDFAQLTHQVNNINSRSGSPNLAIVERRYTTESSVLTSRNNFGADGQVKLNNSISYSTQDDLPKREEFRFNPSLIWQHSEHVNSFYRYDFSDISEETQDTIGRKLTLGVSRTGEKINSSFDLHGQNNETTGLQDKNYGALISLNYRHQISVGDLQLSYNGSYDRNDHQVGLLQVFDEQYALVGTTPLELTHEFIDASTIVVRNISRTQVFVEGLDYRLIIIGSTVQIQRLTAGNILDGETVVLTYSYDTGGTFQDQISIHNAGMRLAIGRYYNLYLRYLGRRQELLEGSPTIPLNSIDRSTVGLQVDRPLSSGISLGGEVSYENSNEDISSYVKENYDAFVELPLPRLTDMRFSARRVRVDNENSPEDVNLTGYLVRINSQPWLRTRLSYEASYETDTGGTIDRLTRIQRLAAGWRVRQLSVTLSANYSVEEQGDIERGRWGVKLIARREFN